MVEKIKKSLVATIIVLMLLPTQLLQVFAVSEGDNPYLKRGSLGTYTVQYDAGGYWVYISYNIVTYVDTDGTERIAYCVTPNTPGIEWTNGSVDGYNVNVKELLSNVELWRVMRHGYPYATPEQMGVENAEDAYLATKLAIQCILLNRPTNQIKTFYRGGQDPVAGVSLADITRRGNKVVDAIYNLVNNARTSSETPTNNTILTVNKTGEFKDEGNNYYSQTYSVSSSTKMSDYTIRNITGFPAGSFTADLNGNSKKTFNNGESFKIMVPKNSITGTINGEMEFATHCETYPILYGEGPSGYQNYALYADPYRDINKTVTTTITPNTAKITIVKVDKDTKEKLSGVTFNAKYENGQNIGDFTTDSNGVIEIKNLMNGTIILTETKTKESYKLKVDKIAVELNVGESKTVEVENETMKGKIKVIKVDQDNNQVKLEGVKFEVTNLKGTVVETLTTDKNGEAITKELPINDTYKVKETVTKQEYVLSDKVETVTLKENEIKNLTFTNEKKKAQIKVIKIDQDNKEVKLEGVKFQVINSKGSVIETITTDKNGEAITSRLPIDDTYKVRESETKQEYVLSDKVETVVLKENEIKNLTFTNEKKKGQIKVIKIDLDNKEVKLEGVTFEITNSKGVVVDTITTDKNGEATTKRLPIDDTYKIKEINTKKEYVLSDNVETVVLKENEIKNLTFTNEKRKGQIKVIKIDQEHNEIKLEGVEFEVRNSKGDLIEKLTTDKNGEATTSRLPIDEEYFVKETKTQKTYILSDDIIKVTLKENEITSLTFTNLKKKGNLFVVKVDKDNNKIGIGGVVFDLFSEEFQKVIGNYTTNVNGEITVENLRVGGYSLIEKITNKWYNLTDDANVEIKWKETTGVEIDNELKKGQIKVIKVDMDNNEVKLAGVTFNVIDQNGTILESITTDENGEASTHEYPVRDFEKLTLKEVETQKDYVLNDTPQTIELKENEITTIKFENELKKGQIKVIKVDLDNNEVKLANVKFEIRDESGKVVDKIVTDINGEAVTKRLPINHEYTVVETETNKAYKLTKETQKVTLKQDEIKSITFNNEKRKGQLRIIKVDLDDNEVLLENVKFQIKDSKGNIVDEVITNEKGEATTKPLPCVDEKYTVVETETQKEYVLTEETKTIELKEDEITSIQFENEKIKGYVEITKVDSKTKEKLEGAKFGIYNEKDEKVGELVTDKDGKATSDLLVCGKYYLKELETGSPYYLLNEDTFEFEIIENHKTVPVEVENDEVEIEVDVDKKGTVEIKPGENVEYEFSNVANNSNIYLENFEWIDYIPTDYVRLQTMMTGTWNQELTYNVYYKTNKSENYILRYNDLTTTENYLLDFTDVELDEDEYITETCFGFGEVQKGFKEDEKPTMNCQSLETLEDGQTFTNKTKTVGTYFNLKAEANSKWTTIVHKPVENHEVLLPRTGK